MISIFLLFTAIATAVDDERFWVRDGHFGVGGR
jgi:hypothetical protein